MSDITSRLAEMYFDKAAAILASKREHFGIENYAALIEDTLREAYRAGEAAQAEEIAQLRAEKERWRIECERLANGLLETFEEQANEDGELKPAQAVDTAFRLLDEWVERAKSAEADLALRTREQDEAQQALEAEHQEKAVDDPDFCQGCGGRYRFDTSIMSPAWNAVIRANGLPEYLCTACIIREFGKRGQGFEATLWGAEFSGERISVTVERKLSEVIDGGIEHRNDVKSTSDIKLVALQQAIGQLETTLGRLATENEEQAGVQRNASRKYPDAYEVARRHEAVADAFRMCQRSLAALVAPRVPSDPA